MLELTGKVALISGAGRGIGAEMARVFARAGAAVLVNDRDADSGVHDVVAQISAAGGRAVAYIGDVSSVAVCRALVEQCVAVFGRVDIVCCHAGITAWGRFLDFEEAAFDTLLDVNLKGAYFLAQAAAREMVRQGGGRIILTSSVVGDQAVRYLSAYALTKAALQMLARNLVLELSPHGITINALAVGPITNERNLANDPQYAAKWGAVTPVGRAGNPADIANAALYLASEAASFVNGSTLTVDGGWTCVSPTPDLAFVEQVDRAGTG